MAGKRKNIYLYLALACFIGIILIFMFDGYMGLYDTLTATVGELPQVIDAEQWQQQAKFDFIPSASIGYGQQGTFSYKIDNRRFSSYSTELNVSVWRNQEKVADILAADVNVKAFDSFQAAWTFNPSTYLPDGLASNTSAEFTLLISHGDIERKLLVYVYSTANQSGIKVPPAR